MKKAFLLIFATVMTMSAMSQNLTLKFTGRMTDGTYVALDSVVVENRNNGWTETLNYPDTVLVFENVVGLAQASSANVELKAFPNPFNGKTNLNLQLAKNDNVAIQVYNLAGQKVAELSQNLEAGTHTFDVSLGASQVYLCVVQTSQGQNTIKLVNNANTGRTSITAKGMTKNIEKRTSTNPFQVGDTMLYIGYATYEGQNYESILIVQEQFASEDITLRFPNGGVFSLSDSTQVKFAPGNLQWSAKAGGTTTTTHRTADGTALGTWRFAENQYDQVGSDNVNISDTCSVWIDLFGWGTSGYNSKHPYLDTTESTYYGSDTNDISGTNYDWGVYNEIYNPSTQTTDAAGTWRTPTANEWHYLLAERIVNGDTGEGHSYQKAIINVFNNVMIGIIIYPDDYTSQTSAVYYFDLEWLAMEREGCVFLPSTGSRDEFGYLYNGEAWYWSATHCSSSEAHTLKFSSRELYTQHNDTRDYGFSVRLVRNF